MRGGHCHGRNNARDWHKSWVNYNRKRGLMPQEDFSDPQVHIHDQQVVPTTATPTTMKIPPLTEAVQEPEPTP
jgi:hypothetical protein